MQRNSAYFRCESGAFEYPKSNKLVLTNAILDGSVWTDKEREKLQKFVHRHGPHNWEQTSILHKSPMDFTSNTLIYLILLLTPPCGPPTKTFSY
jgi:hypothetical protein